MDKWFFYGAAGMSIFVAIVLLIAGPAKDAEAPAVIEHHGETQ